MTNDCKIFGLIGKSIDYSFSRNYFRRKFAEEGIHNVSYVNFDLAQISDVRAVFAQKNAGYNVTIPYKKQIIPYLDQLSDEAQAIGAVNVIEMLPNGQLKGHNTDWYGFYHSIKPLLKQHHQKALVLGTGGASEAIQYVLKRLKIGTTKVSRNRSTDNLTYEDLNENIITEHTIIINCTPLGTFPEVDVCPDISYSLLNDSYLLYDLIYNPEETLFLKQGKKQGATTKNGYEMLVLQAEESWRIWNQATTD